MGAGPGDPDLLTFRALRLMQQADVVLYDRLVAGPIVEMCRRDAERIYVGKRRSEHAVPQEEINRLLIDLALQGKRVLRLKGGIRSSSGVVARRSASWRPTAFPSRWCRALPLPRAARPAGIPLTHRDHAQSVRFVTGHLKDGSSDLPWSDLVAPGQTLVFYMGLVGLPSICSELIRHGRSANTPAALVQQGTTSNQRVFTGTLGDLPQLVARNECMRPRW